jgi:hypothetical protein
MDGWMSAFVVVVEGIVIMVYVGILIPMLFFGGKRKDSPAHRSTLFFSRGVIPNRSRDRGRGMITQLYGAWTSGPLPSF